MATIRDAVTNMLAGGLGGTAGAFVTCPLEVIKTRKQSSTARFNGVAAEASSSSAGLQSTPAGKHISNPATRSRTFAVYQALPSTAWRRALSSTSKPMHNFEYGIYQCLKHIVQTEGVLALWKGLGPNLIGVFPSRAIYFATYSQTKAMLNSVLSDHSWPAVNSPPVHVASAACGGFICTTLTNPLWLVKTRLQLDENVGAKRLTLKKCVTDVYRAHGLLGFMKGVTASYVGISETIIHFVIYEQLKSHVLARPRSESACKQSGANAQPSDHRASVTFFAHMACGGASKLIAATLAYPHEVVRTRLRQPGDQFRGVFRTFYAIYKHESWRALYSGLSVHLLRQIPNTAVMMGVYELVLYLVRPSSPTRGRELPEPSWTENSAE